MYCPHLPPHGHRGAASAEHSLLPLPPPPVQANQPTFNESPHFMLNGSLAGPRSSSHMYLASLERGQEDKTKIPRRPVY